MTDVRRSVSIVVPVYNEEESLRPLHAEITAALGRTPAVADYEIILVDDGSRDRSVEVCRELHAADPAHVRVI
ncbi:MAG TPA: glycosyltransferase, partial [Candidatus Hydrogenedentes bacterium]|nr:glycosyltransferase [Candidatus Hydrogenedentota bacterium]